MRILHIFDHSIPLHSGYTFRSRAILEQQRALGWETAHVTSPKHNETTNSNVAEEDIDGFHFYRTPEQVGLLSSLPVLKQFAISSALFVRLKQIIPQIKPDILHAHSPVLNGLAGAKAAKHFGLPFVYEIRAFWEDAAVDHGNCKEGDLRYRLTRALETRVIKQADAVTTICEGLRQDILGRGVSSSKVTVIPNAVNIEKFRFGGQADDKLKTELGLTGKSVLGFIGSFYAYEGLPLLLEALPLIHRDNADVKLLLVGGGPQDNLLRQRVKQLSLDDHVVFTGRVPHQVVQRYYDLVDVFVYPRLAMRLTDIVTPLKPLEAMALGRLVVASDVGGHKELIHDGENGCLFRADDVTDLSRVVVDLLNNRAQWDEQRGRGRQFVETERNWPGSVARYRNVYSALLGRAV